jgi:hypothetical protein
VFTNTLTRRWRKNPQAAAESVMRSERQSERSAVGDLGNVSTGDTLTGLIWFKRCRTCSRTPCSPITSHTARCPPRTRSGGGIAGRRRHTRKTLTATTSKPLIHADEVESEDELTPAAAPAKPAVPPWRHHRERCST